MTIPATASQVSYAGDGASDEFTIPFVFDTAADLKVILTDEDGVPTEITTGFSVTGGNGSTGTLTMDTAPAVDETLTILDDPERTQPADYTANDAFAADMHEGALDRIVRQVKRLHQRVDRSLRMRDGDAADGDDNLLPLESVRANMFLAFDAGGHPTISSGTGGGDSALRDDLGNEDGPGYTLVAIPITAGELAAGVAIVNPYYEPGCWDRYGNNSTPGTTDMSSAASAAYQVAQQTGCGVTFGATAPYRLASPVNCTQMRGIVTRDLSSKKQANGQSSIIIAHTGHGFDLSASTEMSFHDMVAENESGTVPSTLFFMARNAAESGADFHRFFNIRTPSDCTFQHVFYNYGSEQSLQVGCSIYNARAGSTCYNHNSTNPSGYSSTFVTIATGAQSNVRHVHLGCDYFNLGNSGSSNEVCIAVERTNNLTIIGGMLYAPNGLAYIRVGGTVGSNFLTILGSRGEANASALTLAGIAVRTTAATGSDVHAHWIIENMALDTGNTSYLIDADATSDFLDLNVRGCFASSGNLALLHSATYSIFEHHQQIITAISGGTVSSCKFVGNRASITLSGTDSANLFDDMLTGIRGQTGDTASQSAAACTGAITANSTWAARQSGKAVTLSLPALSATATAAANYSYASALPAGMRPAAIRRFPCIISDNGAVLNQLGFVQISTAGVITVYKDVVGTANFTAAAGAGLPAAQDFTWVVA